MSNNKKIVPSDKLSEFILYTAPSGEVKIEIYVQNETVWLTQQKIANLFRVIKSTISEHLSNIFESGELEKEATVRNFRTVQKEGERNSMIAIINTTVNTSEVRKFRISVSNII